MTIELVIKTLLQPGNVWKIPSSTQFCFLWDQRRTGEREIVVYFYSKFKSNIYVPLARTHKEQDIFLSFYPLATSAGDVQE